MITHPMPNPRNEHKNALLIVLLLMVLIFGMAILSGCNSEKHFQKQASEHPDWLKSYDSVSTSIDTTISKKNDTIKIPSSDIKDSFQLPHFTMPSIDKGLQLPHFFDSSLSHKTGVWSKTIHSGSATLSIKIDSNGKGYIDCKCDSALRIIAQLKEVIRQKEIDKKVIIIPPPKPSFWDKALDWYKNGATWFASIILLLLAIYSGGRALGMIEKIHPKFPW